MTFIPLPQEEEGGQTKVLTTDSSVKEILLEVLKELKMIRTYLLIGFQIDKEITEEDLQ